MKNKKNNKRKLVAGLTTAALVGPVVLGSTNDLGGYAKAQDNVNNTPSNYNSVMYDYKHVTGVKYKKGEEPETVTGDLGFRGYTPYGNKMIPQTPFSSPRVSSAAFLHFTHTEGDDTYGVSGSGVFVAPNIMLTAAHNYLDDITKVLFENLAGHVYIGGTYNFPKKFYDTKDYPDASRVELPNKVGKNVFFKNGIYGDKFRAVTGDDIAVTVFDRPVQLMVKGAEPSPIVTAPYAGKIGDKIYSVGYPAGHQKQDGVLTEATGNVLDKPYARQVGVVPVSADSQSGNSGGGVFNTSNEVIGTWAGSHKGDSAGNSEYNSFTPLNAQNHAWVKSLIDKYGIKGWYTEGGKKYYFDNNGQMVKESTRVIDNKEYKFDSSGAVVAENEKAKGIVKVKYVSVDENDKVIETDNATGEVRVGDTYKYTPSTFANYDFVKVRSGALEGKVAEGEQTIVLEYKLKRGNLTINHRVGASIIKSEEVKDLAYGTKKVVGALTIPGYTPVEETGSIVIERPSNVLDLFYSRNKYTVTVKHVVDGEVQGNETAQVYYGDKFTPKVHNFKNTVYVSGADEVEVKENKDLEVHYKRVKAGGVRAIYKLGDTVVKTEELLPGGKAAGTKYKLDLPESGEFEQGGKTYVITERVSGELEGVLTESGIDIVYSVKEKGSNVATDKTEVKEEQEKVDIVKYQTEYKDDATLDEGKEIVEREGVDGYTLNTYKVTYKDGKVVSRDIQKTTKQDPVNKVVKRGTKKVAQEKSGVVTISYDNKGTVVKTTTLVDAEKVVGTKYQADFGVEDTIEVGRVVYKIKSIKGDLTGVSTKEPKTIKVVVAKVTADTAVEDKEIGYKTKTVEDATLEKGKRVVVTKGVNGSAKVTYDVIYEDGVEVSRVPVKVDTVKGAVDEVVKVGTKEVDVVNPDKPEEPTKPVTPTLEEPTKPVTPELPKVEDNVKTIYTTKWVTMDDKGNEITLRDTVSNGLGYRDLVEIDGYFVVDSNIDTTKGVKTYIYKAGKKPSDAVNIAKPNNPAEPKKLVVLKKPVERKKPVEPKKEEPNKDVPKKDEQQGGKQDGGTIKGDHSQLTTPRAVNDAANKGRIYTPGNKGSLSKTGLADTSATTIAGLFTLGVAALLGFITRRKSNK